MKTIYKYEVPLTVNGTLTMHPSAVILHTALQNGTPFVWACVDISDTPKEPTKSTTYSWFGTGHPLPKGDWLYHGTILTHDEHLIFHLHTLQRA